MFGVSVLRRLPRIFRNFSSVSGSSQTFYKTEQACVSDHGGPPAVALEAWASNPAFRSCMPQLSMFKKGGDSNKKFQHVQSVCSPNGRVFPKEYILPNSIGSECVKISILDPLAPKVYELPVRSRVISEIVTPTLDRMVPITDPASSPVVEKEAAWLVRQRRRKMKKHQLRKLRKRMRFVIRARKLTKKKKKEEHLQARLRKINSIGDTFEAEEFVMRKLELARKGGYKVDIFR